MLLRSVCLSGSVSEERDREGSGSVTARARDEKGRATPRDDQGRLHAQRSPFPEFFEQHREKLLPTYRFAY